VASGVRDHKVGYGLGRRGEHTQQSPNTRTHTEPQHGGSRCCGNGTDAPAAQSSEWFGGTSGLRVRVRVRVGEGIDIGSMRARGVRILVLCSVGNGLGERVDVPK
jgi:hypothetical protein